MRGKWGLHAALIGVLAAAVPQLRAANCALRNPDRQIYEIFPAATAYRSIVGRVDAKLKPSIEQALGGELALNDVGKHIFYLVLKNGVPIGFIHARSEIGKTGSVELVWALDLDMRVRDLRVQRSREMHTNAIRDAAFRNRLIGKDYHDLRGFLTDSNATVDTARLQVSRDAERIAHTAVLSGVTTIVITNIAFSGPVLKARLLGNTHRFFPATAKVTEIRSPFNGEAVAAVERLTGHPPRELDRESFKVLRALDGEGHTRGILVFSRWSAHPTSPELWWAVTPHAVLEQVVLVGDVEAETTRAFSRLQGKKLTELAAANNPSTVSAVRCGTEVLAVLTTHGIGE